MKSNFGDGLQAKIESLRQQGTQATGSKPPDAPEPPNSGGITVSMDLLPGVKDGDEVVMVVNKVDPEKNEVHLSIKQ